MIKLRTGFKAPKFIYGVNLKLKTLETISYSTPLEEI